MNGERMLQHAHEDIHEISPEEHPVEKISRSEHVRDTDPEQLPGVHEAPEDILRRLRSMSGQERKEAIAECRELLQQQREELAFLYNDLTRQIQKNPGISKKELQQQAMDAAKKLHLDASTLDAVNRVIDRFEENRLAIHDVREAYPDDRELFKYLFGSAPQGTVEIYTTPAMIYVRCNSTKDFTSAYWYEGSELELTKEQKRRSNASGGVALYRAQDVRLTGLIALEKNDVNKRLINIETDPLSLFRRRNIKAGFDSLSSLPQESRETAVHEEQHIIHRLFTDFPARTTHEMDWPEWRQELLRKSRAWRHDVADKNAATEMLAYFSDGSSREIIENELLGKTKLYDYLNPESLALLEEWLYQNFSYDIADEKGREKEAKDMSAQIVTEYRQAVHQALDALYELKDFLPQEAITAHFVTEPITRWPRISRELLRREAAKYRP